MNGSFLHSPFTERQSVQISHFRKIQFWPRAKWSVYCFEKLDSIVLIYYLKSSSDMSALHSRKTMHTRTPNIRGRRQNIYYDSHFLLPFSCKWTLLCFVFDFRQMSPRRARPWVTAWANEQFTGNICIHDCPHCLIQIFAKQHALDDNKTLHTRY